MYGYVKFKQVTLGGWYVVACRYSRQFADITLIGKGTVC